MDIDDPEANKDGKSVPPPNLKIPTSSSSTTTPVLVSPTVSSNPTTRPVIVTKVTGEKMLVSTPHTSLPKPPPLIADSNSISQKHEPSVLEGQSSTPELASTPKPTSTPELASTPKPTSTSELASAPKLTSTPGLASTLKLLEAAPSPTIKKEPGGVIMEPTTSKPDPLVLVLNPRVTESAPSSSNLKDVKFNDLIQKKPEAVVSLSGGTLVPGGGGGGLGAGKPKSFLALMGNSTPKKQSIKKPANRSGGSGGSKGQGYKNKSSALSQSKKSGDSAPNHTPSRSSNRSIKRPRTYDEELDDLKNLKSLATTKKSKGTGKGPRALGNTRSGTIPGAINMKNLSRWRPTDDLMLISAVQQTNDLTAVHLGVNFSCKFTLQDVEEHWHALLYSSQVSQQAIDAMRGLHPGVVTMALNNALWSQEEEAVLARIPTTDPGHLEKFQAVLRENPAVFHTCRTATSLHHHWVLMGHNSLLNNQKVDLIPPEENIKEFADAENSLEDNELMKPKDVREAALDQELMVSDRQAKKEILKLEDEVVSWRLSINTGSGQEFGVTDLALFKGKVVEFRMTKRAVCLGRSTNNNSVDFDLSLEGPAFKISRRQATIQLTESGEFQVYNEGKRPLYVSGKVVPTRTSARLGHNQVMEIAHMSFLILLNNKLAAATIKNSTVM